MELKFILPIIFLGTFAQAQDVLWEKSMGGKQADYLMDATATPDYGFLLAGSSLSGKSGNKTVAGNGDLDYWLWKMNENGDLDWQKSFGGTGNDFLHCVRLTNDGGYILGGTSNSTDFIDDEKQPGTKKQKCRGGDDFWVIKLDAAGNEDWQQTIGGMGQEKLKSIAPTKDGGYILGGSSASPNPSPGEQDPEELKMYGDKKSENFGNMDYWVVKLDNKGKIVWQKTFGGIYEDELRSIEATNDGGYIIGGYSNSPQSGNKSDDNKGTGDFWILKLDQSAEITWQKTIGGNQDDQLYMVHQTQDGNYVVGGNSNSEASNEKRNNNSNGTDFWVLKLGQEGEIIWQETYDIGAVDILTSIVENKDGTLLIGGTSPLTPEGGTPNGVRRIKAMGKIKAIGKKSAANGGEFIAIKTKEDGEEIWRQSVGSGGNDLLKKAIETRDGGYLLAGIGLPPAPSKGGGAETYQTVDGGGTRDSSLPRNDNFGLQQTENQQFQNIKNEINGAIGGIQKDLNKEISALMPSNAGKQELGSINYGLNLPTEFIKLPILGNNDNTNTNSPINSATSPTSAQNSSTPTPSSTSLAPPLGVGGLGLGLGLDFRVVKLRDEDKKPVVRVRVEAAPNPTTAFTNIVIGYEFVSGTATVADIAGHILQQFDIKTRTVPIDLESYPEGIYIVNIATNVSSDGVEVIKKGNKN